MMTPTTGVELEIIATAVFVTATVFCPLRTVDGVSLVLASIELKLLLLMFCFDSFAASLARGMEIRLTGCVSLGVVR